MTDQVAAHTWLAAERVARLATADAAGAPHVVPVCFALSGDGQGGGNGSLYIAIDEKPKDTSRPLKRIRNILANPQVALIADRYAEDWTQLGWVMVRGRAVVLEPANGGSAQDEHAVALALLRAKYPQYRQMALEGLPVIAVRIARLTWWGRLGP